MEIATLVSVVVSTVTQTVPFIQETLRRREKARKRQRLFQVGILTVSVVGLIWLLTYKR